MIYADLFILLFAMIPAVINLFRGKQYYVIKRSVMRSRGWYFCWISVDIFLFIVWRTSEGSFENDQLSTLIMKESILCILIAILIYELIYVKEGVYERGLILRGFLYEWEAIDMNSFEYCPELQIFQFQYKSKRKYRRKNMVCIKVDYEVAKEISETVEKRFDPLMDIESS